MLPVPESGPSPAGYQPNGVKAEQRPSQTERQMQTIEDGIEGAPFQMKELVHDIGESVGPP